MCVSIVMGVRNGMPFVEDAILSIRRQSYLDWELIVVDDGSDDTTNEILAEQEKKDRRIRIYRNSNNMGLPYSLNKAISLANGDLVARFDSDDLMSVGRIATQVKFLRNHREIGIVGSNALLIDECGVVHNSICMPKNHWEIVWREMTGLASAFLHPSTMFRKRLLIDNKIRYDESLLAAQDKKLWFELLQVTKGANLSAKLIKYRRHSESISTSKSELQSENAREVCRQWLVSVLCRNVDDLQLDEIVGYVGRMERVSPDTWGLIEELRLAMRRQFPSSRCFTRKSKLRDLFRYARAFLGH